ncbi:MAG: ATP-binding protein [Elusimicrobiales bacterium]|nr:ATP-binding protein [Elusimicrobiales bacterium]
MNTRSSFISLLLSLALSNMAAAADLGGKIFSFAEGPACEKPGPARVKVGTLPELKKYLERKTGVYCISWPILKKDYEGLTDPAIYVGRTGDVSEFYLNGKKLGLTGRVPAAGWHLQAVHSSYYLPGWLLGDTNEAVLKIDKFFRLGSGPLDDLELGSWDHIRQKTRLRNYVQTDLLMLLSILFAFVGVFIFGLFRRHPNFSSYRTFSAACVAGALFSLSLSRVLYFFIMDYAAIYKFNCTVATLFFYFFLTYFYGNLRSARHFRAFNAAGSAVFLAGILFSPTLKGTSDFYAAWLYFVYFNLLLVLGHTLFKRRELPDHASRAAGTGILLAALTHDILVYANYISGTNTIPYGIFIVLFSFVFIVLTDMEQIYLAASKTDFAVRERNKMQKDLTRVTSIAAVGQIASQVAHDIRSPLAALDASLKNASQLPEEQRVMVRHAVNRIRDIANNLLEKTRLRPAADKDGAGEPLELSLLSSVIDPVITEKRMQFGSRPGIHIDFELTKESYGLFSRVQPVEFGRVISNLVNNAVEVLGERGSVRLGLTHENGTVLLTVADTGKGIPKEILKKLGQRGGTYGKAGGYGLGLSHAKSAVESWGGSLAIASEQGKGTVITVKLPRSEMPADFVRGLELVPGRPVVVLDDDSTIHHVWQGRFKQAGVAKHDIDIIHFIEPVRLRKWVQSDREKAMGALYLFDYELIGYTETGLSLARELGLGSRVILVTSRHEEKPVIEEARRLKIRIVQKGLAGLVPISVMTVKRPTRAVLLDDDMLVQMNWKLAAKSAGVEFSAYETPEELATGLEGLPKDTPLYIDSELGRGVKGEEVAGKLRGQGFTDLTLSTGHPPEHFQSLPWLKVTGKEPPWG